MPFRKAHEVVGTGGPARPGAAVRAWRTMPLDEYQQLSPLIGEDVYDGAVGRGIGGQKDVSTGGTAPRT